MLDALRVFCRVPATTPTAPLSPVLRAVCAKIRAPRAAACRFPRASRPQTAGKRNIALKLPEPCPGGEAYAPRPVGNVTAGARIPGDASIDMHHLFQGYSMVSPTLCDQAKNARFRLRGRRATA